VCLCVWFFGCCFFDPVVFVVCVCVCASGVVMLILVIVRVDGAVRAGIRSLCFIGSGVFLC